MVDRMGDAEQLAIERVDRLGQQAMALAARRTGGDLVERSGTTPDGSSPNASGRWGSPVRFSSGIRGTIPSLAYSAFEIGWALSAATARTIVGIRRQHPVDQLAPEARPLVTRQHEQHRQVPQPLAHGRRGEGDDLGRVARHRRDDEPLGSVPGGARTGG